MSGCRSCSGRLFHSVGQAVAKQRSANWLRDLLTKHVRLSADCKGWRPAAVTIVHSSARYTGAECSQWFWHYNQQYFIFFGFINLDMFSIDGEINVADLSHFRLVQRRANHDGTSTSTRRQHGPHTRWPTHHTLNTTSDLMYFINYCYYRVTQ